MSPRPQQLTFDLPHRSALGAEDLLVSSSNRAAVAFVDRWPDWTHWAAVVSGPAGSGKSHLAHVWQLRSGAAIRAASEVSEADVEVLGAHGCLVIEDLDRGIASERALFHLLNLAREHRLAILMTSRRPPGELEIPLPDLRSRLRALPLIVIDQPDEALLRGVLVKLFSDRQLLVEPHIIHKLSLGMERSMEAATRLVAEVDRLALERGQKVTRPLVAEALRRLAVPDLDLES